MTTILSNHKPIFKVKKYSVDWWESLPPEKVGKETEKIVEALFTKWNESSKFAWHRFPDARAARGHMAAQPADYLFFRAPYGGLLEVKATHHAYRLAKDKVRQHAILVKFNQASAQSIVLVNHYTIGKWRTVAAEALELGAESWDLSLVPAFDTAEEALRSMKAFANL